MHELSIAVHLVRLACDALADADDVADLALRSVRVRVGDLAGVVPESLLFAWDVASEGTRCDGATLDIERVAATIRCAPCDEIVELAAPHRFRCPTCGTPSAEVVAGRELELAALELDEPAPSDAAESARTLQGASR